MSDKQKMTNDEFTEKLLESMQPSTYWERRAYITEQFVEKIVATGYRCYRMN